MLKWINKKRNQKGFTLVELVVVIAILGILAAIAVPKLGKSRTSAAVSAHNANVRTLESAANMYIADIGTIPSGGVTWKTDDSWEEYVQEWPEVPNALVGKTWATNDDDKTGILIGKEYSVVINENGDIEIKTNGVKTGKIINKEL